jgi:glutamate carboxypeptidase
MLPVVLTLLSLAMPARGAPPPVPRPDSRRQRDTLTPIERALTRHVDRHNAEGLELLQRLVNINSGTMNFPGVQEVGAVLRAELDALGFATRWEDGAPYHRAGHLIAERTGKGRKLLLIGHLDTVFERESPFQRFEKLDSTHARGPGVIDMKGGDVIVVQALKALKAAGALDRMSLTAVFHGDEEHAGEPQALARRALIEAAKGAAAAVAFEDGDGDPATAVAARRGSSSWLLQVTGTPAHSSQIFREDIGPGAIFEAARILQGFREKLTGDPLLTFNPGVALGGTAVSLDSAQVKGEAAGKSNVVAERMVVSGDLRTISPEKLAWARTEMRAIAAAHLPRTTAQIDFDDGYPPMPPTEGNQRLLALYDRVSRDLGYGPVGMDNPAKAGAADVSFVAGIVPMAIDGIGLAGTDDHTAKETADLAALPMQVKRAAVLLYRLGAPELRPPD